MTRSRTQRTTQIVVGLDRTGSQDHAVLTAAFEHAQRAHADLCVVHAIALDDPPLDHAARHQRLTARHDRVQAATAALRRQVAHLGGGDTVRYEISYGDPATVILAAAQHADLIVVGTRSNGGHGSPLLLGTVSQDIAVHATCPVLLIPS